MASKQHGIVTTEQLFGLGMSPDQIQRWVEAGRLHRLHRGVFAVVVPALLNREGIWVGAVFAGGPGAALSHGPGGQLLGIVGPRERFALHVTVAGRFRRRPAGIVIHRPRNIDPCDFTRRRGIAVTTPTRTVWDLAAVQSPGRTRDTFRQAEKLRLLDRGRLAALLAATPNRKGAGTIRELLGAQRLPLDRTRTWLEDQFVLLCEEHGLPMPLVNAPLLDYEVDFLWPAARYVVEADGGDHLTPEQRDKDNEKDARLQRAGYMVRRHGHAAIRRGREVAAEVLADLEARLS